MASIEIYNLSYLFLNFVKIFIITFHSAVLRSLRLKCSLNCTALATHLYCCFAGMSESNQKQARLVRVRLEE